MLARSDREMSSWNSTPDGVLDCMVRAVKNWAWLRAHIKNAARIIAKGRFIRTTLTQEQLLTMEGLRYAQIDCTRGRAWITVEGCRADVELRAGKTLRVGKAGKLVIVGKDASVGLDVWWK